ncbi:hypothetical protein CW304_02680 [Bacillus sp. UFRGS-B20]|nr:hypothetical protein CW304_02680 [Bacillus sp. UFRGS-B20]
MLQQLLNALAIIFENYEAKTWRSAFVHLCNRLGMKQFKLPLLNIKHGEQDPADNKRFVHVEYMQTADYTNQTSY